MINFQLGKEIYGANPWFVDQQTLPGLLGIVEAMQNGTVLETPEVKYNSCQIIPTSGPRVVRGYQDLKSDEEFTGVGIININGPITVGGGASSFGMKDQAKIIKSMAVDNRVKGFIILADSGGGSTSAVEIMTEAILEVKKTKQVIGLVDKGGVAASACYGILSACTSIYAESEMSIIGSAGTMIQFSGRAANSEDPDGVKHIRVYATKSTKKNAAFEEALNNDNYKLLHDELLDPLNERFLQMISDNRPQLKNTTFDDGHTVFAKDTVGSFIDGIKTFSEVLEIASENTENNFNLNPEKMTITELKSAHPETYNSIFDAGVGAERDRAGAWLAHSETDLPAVKAGIESGEGISATKREQFLVKGASLSHVKNLAADSTEDVQEETVEEAEESTESDDFYAKIDATLKKDKN